MQDAGCRRQEAGCRMQDALVPVVGRPLLSHRSELVRATAVAKQPVEAVDVVGALRTRTFTQLVPPWYRRLSSPANTEQQESSCRHEAGKRMTPPSGRAQDAFRLCVFVSSYSKEHNRLRNPVSPCGSALGPEAGGGINAVLSWQQHGRLRRRRRGRRRRRRRRRRKRRRFHNGTNTLLQLVHPQTCSRSKPIGSDQQ
ncbi:unnamed protein product [Pleuronectes platessa]|uniref:Uncharacterized protein n=1 Tax=Pleuronectes platessa TaxID=8262 RepID=A0A9N7US30_PLEPL|nr:unnamed protein product [Pleuronectes platessa]